MAPVAESGKTYDKCIFTCGFDSKYARLAVCNNWFPIPRGLGRS